MAGEISLSSLAKDAVWDGGIKDFLANGVVRIYGGTPTDSDTATTATTLVEVTESGGAFTAGVSTNGLNLGSVTPGNGYIEKSATEDWEGAGLVDDTTATWFRHFNNAMTGWIQGTVNTSNAVMTVSTTAIQASVPVTVTSCKYRF